MCGIAGCVNLKGNVINSLEERLTFMNKIQEHRGPDGDGKWINSSRSVGLSHTRLSIIDLTPNASQPMLGEDQNVLTFNGEIYNYKEIKNKLKGLGHLKATQIPKQSWHPITNINMNA